VNKRNENEPKRKGLPSKISKKKLTPLKIIIAITLVLFLTGCAGIFAMYTANWKDISDTEYQRKEKTIIYSADQQIIAELFSQNRTYVTLDQVPQNLRNALIATEDRRFYSHHGVDYIGIVRAAVGNVVGGGISSGASTITQQLARLLYLDPISTEQTKMDTFNRKFAEISIARQLEKKYSKDQILEMYFNEYYFGSGAYGIQEAAQTYFGKNISEVNLAEASMLAGIPQAPTAYAPNNDFDAAKARQNIVLNRMLKENYIDQAQLEEAVNTEIHIQPWSEAKLNDQMRDGYEQFIGKAFETYARNNAESVMKERGLSEEDAVTYIRGELASGGYKIYTTVNVAYQDNAINTMNELMPAYGMTGEKDSSALVSVNTDGAVLAYYGGDYNKTQVDMANSPRQPGSNIKPLYYSLALQNGTYSPGSTIKDVPTTFGAYKPSNYGGGFSGNVSITTALAQSLNVPAVKVFNAIGINNSMEWMKRMGITTVSEMDYNLATALGGMTDGIKPLDMAAAFNIFNNGGVYNSPYYITKIEKTDGTPVYDYKEDDSLVAYRVLSEEIADQMWNILNQVVTGGTGTAAYPGYPTAGKTGTTDNDWDLWFTGMTGNTTTAVWLGNEDHHPIGMGSYVAANVYGTYARGLVQNDLIPSIALGDEYQKPENHQPVGPEVPEGTVPESAQEMPIQEQELQPEKPKTVIRFRNDLFDDGSGDDDEKPIRRTRPFNPFFN
jgi:penicillin-binding protein 1A